MPFVQSLRQRLDAGRVDQLTCQRSGSAHSKKKKKKKGIFYGRGSTANGSSFSFTNFDAFCDVGPGSVQRHCRYVSRVCHNTPVRSIASLLLNKESKTQTFVKDNYSWWQKFQLWNELIRPKNSTDNPGICCRAFLNLISKFIYASYNFSRVSTKDEDTFPNYQSSSGACHCTS